MIRHQKPSLNKVSNYDDLIDLIIKDMGNTISFKNALQANTTTRTALFTEWNNYNRKLSSQNLYSLQKFNSSCSSPIVGVLTHENLIKLYGGYFSKSGKEVKDVYNELLSKVPYCPYCGNIGKSAQLDHYLPKTHYPQYSIHLNNLVPSCRDCNEGCKKALYPKNKGEQFIHPYGDKGIFFDEQWIFAEFRASLLLDKEATVHYYVNAPTHWSGIDKHRAEKHFNIFDLGGRFAMQAVNGWTNILTQLNKLSHLMMKNELISYYQDIYNEIEFPINHWNKVMYQALCHHIDRFM